MMDYYVGTRKKRNANFLFWHRLSLLPTTANARSVLAIVFHGRAVVERNSKPFSKERARTGID
jgi:hypothetical protein